ncbi:hypothetical protein [Lysobacter sp. CA199]|uniref:hypothetical protein n=1 Tax=Lysobacter sp. CA199 TaxID=3455608 RepID=UPI003F8D7D14
MRRLFAPLALVLLFAAVPPVNAGVACHIEGQVGGQIINECTESALPIPEAQMKEQCNGQIPGLEQLGGEANATLVAACPAGANGVCDSPMGAQAKIYYYKRNAEQLATIQRSCEMQRGKWTKP